MTFSRRFNRAPHFLLPVIIILLVAFQRSAQTDADPELKVLATGVGFGRIVSTDGRIDCGRPMPPGAPTTNCRAGYGTSDSVTLQPSSGSTISEWLGDCAGTPATNPCTLTMSSARSVRARFAPERPIPLIPVFNTTTGAASTRVFSPTTFLNSDEVIRPEDIRTYLLANDHVNSPARFLAALLPEFKMNWVLMSRSESLQTGTAQSPRILLPSADGRFVFTIGMTPSSSYPGSHPNAIEFMQWDAAQKNFRFHEIILASIPDMGDTITFPDTTTVRTFPARPTRGVTIDDAKCFACHSTRNVLNFGRTPTPGSRPGTDIIPPGSAIPPGTIMAKNKPNWDTYDSWGGMMPFNRDRIYKGSIEAAAFRKIFNPWTWSGNPAIGTILDQLKLQPDGVASQDVISQIPGGADEGQIGFAFDDSSPVTTEPTPDGSATPVNYSFDRLLSTSTGTPVTRGGRYVLLRHTSDLTSSGENVEGRGVQLFDLLGGADGSLNQQRIVDELIKHRIAPGSVPIDVRPVALAITTGCLTRSNAATAVARFGFFTNRNGGLTLDQIFNNTLERAQSIPRRKADVQGLNVNRTPFDRPLDIYFDERTTPTPSGLLQEYGTGTSLTTTGVERLRQEVFRRPPGGGFLPDAVIGGFYVDRENYAAFSSVPARVGDGAVFNTEKLALYRYFLEPLGVSVDKWSMGVRGRSRTYSFADVFKDNGYVSTLTTGLEQSLNNPADRFPGLTGAPPYSCTNLLAAVDRSFSGLLADGSGPIPTYTDVQRIFNKSCIECHGGLLYPPYRNFVSLPNPADPTDIFGPDDHLDLSEEEDPTRGGRRRMQRSHANAVARIATPPESSQIYRRIIDTREHCPYGLMPCGGPPLSQADINTILRWLRGSPNIYSEGDPHIRTIDEVDYDFQSAGEFVLLRGEDLEIQTRQIAIDTGSPLGPDEHTGLSSCVSVNGAVAVRIGGHRITYQPDNDEQPEASRLQLRVDREPATLTAQGIPVDSGVRIMQSTAPGGIRIESPGGTTISVTPMQWAYGWFMNINVSRARATEGIMGPIAPGSWLPALPDGSSLGPMPADLHQRYVDLYEKFEAAWRVTDANTLFDYAPGTSTGTFTIESWPIENPQTCQVPRQVKGQPPRSPLPALSAEAAQQACARIVANARKDNCIKDVMVTGETKFADAYLLTEQIERNGSPTVPGLNSPTDYADDRADLASPVTFSWGSSTDPDGDAVTYRHCVWVLGQRPDNNRCEPTAVATTSKYKTALWTALLFLLLCLLFLLFLIFVRKNKKLLVLAPLAIVVVALVIVVFYIGRAEPSSATVSKTFAQLQPGKEYFWKVIAEDGKGGIAESETRRFKTR